MLALGGLFATNSSATCGRAGVGRRCRGLRRPAPAASVACLGGAFAGFTSGAREERPAVQMHLPPPVGDEDFCLGDEFTVYHANGGMPPLFCISLLESV